MEKQVFLAIFVSALVKFQGINGIPSGCSCNTKPDPNDSSTVGFAFVATVTRINFIPHVVPTGYNSILVVVKQLCAGKMPHKNEARLNTLKCSSAFSHLKEYQDYFFYGTYKKLDPDNRISFIVDSCAPPCNPTTNTCRQSMNLCHSYSGYTK